MSWIEHHKQSEQYASLAEVALKQQDIARALGLYRQAAEYETRAWNALELNKTRTWGIIVVSVAALWFKARDFRQAQLIAYQGLAQATMPAFAVHQLQSLLQAIWDEEAHQPLAIEGEMPTRSTVRLQIPLAAFLSALDMLNHDELLILHNRVEEHLTA